MILDTETAILARLATRCAAGSILLGTFGVVDLTDPSPAPVVGIVGLQRIDPTEQQQAAARLECTWSFSVYTDIHRASPTQKTAAAALLEAAGNALVGWEISPGKYVSITAGQDSAFDGRILRLSFGFSVPSFFVGS
jgi:hypothetical protein